MDGESMRILITTFCTILILSFYSSEAYSRITFAPYFSIRSTKSVDPSKENKNVENEKVKKRTEYGVRAGLGFWRLFMVNLSLGQSIYEKTEKAQYAADEYDEIDFEEDLNMSTDDPDKDVITKDTQRRLRFSLILDPSFWIFIMRAKIGITATQRIMELQEAGEPAEKEDTGIVWKPHSGVGVGIRFGPRMYGMIEYGAYHYKFPDVEPFERELTVSYAIAI